MISIQRLKKEEIPALSEFLNNVWVNLYGDFLPKETIRDIASSWLIPELFLYREGNADFLLALAKNDISEIVGLSAVTKIGGDIIKINRLFVSPPYQRQGIGKRFLKESESSFPFIRRIKVEVEGENYKSRFFYLKEGFKDRKSKEEKVDGENKRVIFMEKTINKREGD